VEVEDIFPDGPPDPFVLQGKPLDSTTSGDFKEAVACSALFPIPADEAHRITISPLFSIYQTDKTRLIFDLRQLNSSASDPSFGMETLFDLPALAARARFASKIDLTKAFWQVPLSQKLSQLLGCLDEDGQTWAWRALPFGLSHSPRLFSAVTHAFREAWRHAGLNVLVYIDDILILSETLEEHVAALEVVINDLFDAGIRVSDKKAFIRPYEILDFLGMCVHLVERAFEVPPPKRCAVQDEASSILRRGNVTRRALLAFLGRIAYISVACPFAAAFRTELLRSSSTGDHTNLSEIISVDESARQELIFWSAPDALHLILDRRWPWVRFAKTRLYAHHASPASLPTFHAWGDASDFGAGLAGDKVLALPSSECLPSHILGVPVAEASSTVRELWVILRLIQLARLPRGSTIRIFCDNQAAVASANGSSVCYSTAPLVQLLLRETLAREVTLYVDWLPRELLEDVDERSRWFRSLEHAMLGEEVYQRVWDASFSGRPPDLDMFASASARIEGANLACSRIPETDSVGDAISINPRRVASIWAFPPFGLVRAFCNWMSHYRDVLPPTAVCLPDSSFTRGILRLLQAELLPPPAAVLCPPTYTFSREPSVPLLLARIPTLTTPLRLRLTSLNCSLHAVAAHLPVLILLHSKDQVPEEILTFIGLSEEAFLKQLSLHRSIVTVESQLTRSAPVFCCSLTQQPRIRSDEVADISTRLRRLFLLRGITGTCVYVCSSGGPDKSAASPASVLHKLGPGFRAWILR
jgi:hypothetical protein